MSKRKTATIHGVGHGNQRSKLHGIDVQKNKELRRKRKEEQKEAREVVPLEDEPVFRSDVSGLGGGKCFRVENGKLVEMDGDEWEEALWVAALDRSWYHQCQRRKLKSGKTVEELKRRKIKDRVKLGRTDKHGRPKTDVMRETIDLRPDHSRVIQYLLDAGMRDEARGVVDWARELKIRLFEKIYSGRRVLFPAEHDDAGQHHDDLWHSGITDDPDEMIRGRENRKSVLRPKRTRVPFLAYGVGIGAVSWSRHFSALRDAGVADMEMEKFARPTMAALEEDISQELQRHGRPRDIRLLAVLDRLVHRKLKKIAPDIAVKANREYADFLKENYRAGRIGVKASKRERIAELEQELEEERQASEELRQAVAAERARVETTEEEVFSALQYLQPADGESMDAAAGRLVRERDDAQAQRDGLWDLIAGFISAIMTKEFLGAVAQWPAEIIASLAKLAKAVGQEFDFLNRQQVPTRESLSSPKLRRDAKSPNSPVDLA